MKACVLTFNPQSGTGTQTVTGVVDHAGVPFVGKVFFFQSAYAAINTVTSGNVVYPWYADSRGVDTGSIRSARSVADAWSAFNFKSVAGAESLGDHSILDQWADNFGNAQIYRTAKISAIRSGEFDVTYATNTRNGDTILVLVLGGSDFDFTFTNTTNGTYTTAAKPQGILALPIAAPSSGGATAGGAGGQDIPWGFATRDGAYGTSNLNVVSQGENWHVQRSTAFSSVLNATTGAISNLPTISAWTDTSFTLANGTSASIPLALCGDTIRTAGGTLTQPVATGTQTVSTGIDARVILFWGVGEVSATTVYSGAGQLSMGWATPSAQVGYWGGDRKVGNTGPAGYGARYLSDDSVIRFGNPDSQSTTFHSVASVTAVSSITGDVVLDWSAVDGTAREILWFAVGHDVSLAPVAPSEPCCCSCDDGNGSGGGTDGGTSTGSTGPILPPIDPTSWTPSCSGGGTVPSAADATDSESWIS